MDVQELIGKLLGYVALYVAGLLTMYIAFAFTIAEINPFLWDPHARGFYLVGAFAFIVIRFLNDIDTTPPKFDSQTGEMLAPNGKPYDVR